MVSFFPVNNFISMCCMCVVVYSENQTCRKAAPSREILWNYFFYFTINIDAGNKSCTDGKTRSGNRRIGKKEREIWKVEQRISKFLTRFFCLRSICKIFINFHQELHLHLSFYGRFMEDIFHVRSSFLTINFSRESFHFSHNSVHLSMETTNCPNFFSSAKQQPWYAVRVEEKKI